MNLTFHYCPERKRLEQCGWNLVSILFGLTSRLMILVGNHMEFVVTRTRCKEVKEEILESRRQLQDHRSIHGC